MPSIINTLSIKTAFYYQYIEPQNYLYRVRTILSGKILQSRLDFDGAVR